jgi:4-hydroxymandelate oxidase
VRWLSATTGLPVVVKGVLRPDDARRCVEAGASAVWVSNHGGRQLDFAAPTAAVLAGVAEAVAPAVGQVVGGAAEVYVDGGVRNGRHVLTALALGARAVFLGRPPLFALAVDGESGVRRLLEQTRDELVEAMVLSGCHDVSDVGSDLLSGRTSG